MRDLGVRLPPPRLDRRGSGRRELFYFCAAFAATFGGALLALDLVI
jgi:hypothetical protein